MPPKAAYFDAKKIVSNEQYVAWVDVMGTRAMMTRSLNKAANFVYKLHVAALETPHLAIKLYPMNDGVFAVADDWKVLEKWIGELFQRIHLANAFPKRKPNWRKVFLVRAAIAFGEVAEGRNLAADSSATLDKNPTYRDKILLGPPVVNAFLTERYASPFGIAVHESARTFGRVTQTGPVPVLVWRGE